MTIGFPRNGIRQALHPAGMQRSRTAGKTRHRQIERPPEKVHGRDLAEITCPELFEDPSDADKRPVETLDRSGIVRSHGRVMLERHGISNLAWRPMHGRCSTHRTDSFGGLAEKRRDTHGTERERGAETALRFCHE